MGDDSLSEGPLPIIWIIGGPGAGRTTQCKQLELYTNFCHISSGDVLRNEVMSGSDRALKIYTCMFNGNPVPDEVKCEIIEEEMKMKRINKDPPPKGFLMDGFPLDLHQASSFVEKIGRPSAIIHLDVIAPIMELRCKERKNFDDEIESIRNRISLFQEKTRPLIREWKPIKIDGNKTEKEVYESIKESLMKVNLYEEVKLNVKIS